MDQHAPALLRSVRATTRPTPSVAPVMRAVRPLPSAMPISWGNVSDVDA
jgi:hypothetical protein